MGWFWHAPLKNLTCISGEYECIPAVSWNTRRVCELSSWVKARLAHIRDHSEITQKYAPRALLQPFSCSAIIWQLQVLYDNKVSTRRRDKCCAMRWRCARQTWHFVLWRLVVAVEQLDLWLIKQECRATIMSDDVWRLKCLMEHCQFIDLLSFTPTLPPIMALYVVTQALHYAHLCASMLQQR